MIREGVKQKRSWKGYEEKKFIPKWGGNLLHTFTSPVLNAMDYSKTPKNMALFWSKTPFVKVCELYIFIVVLLLENLFLNGGQIVKQIRCFSSRCEEFASLPWGRKAVV